MSPWYTHVLVPLPFVLGLELLTFGTHTLVQHLANMSSPKRL